MALLGRHGLRDLAQQMDVAARRLAACCRPDKVAEHDRVQNANREAAPRRRQLATSALTPINSSGFNADLTFLFQNRERAKDGGRQLTPSDTIPLSR